MSVENITAQDLRKKLKNNPDDLEIIDVREKDEYDLIHIKGSKLISMNQLTNRLDEINWDKEVVFICRSGSRSSLMANLASDLTKQDIKNLNYGIYECFKDDKGEFLEGDFLNENQGVGNYF